MRYTWAVESHVGRVREGNEDSFAPPNDGASEGPVIIAVADGMGGHVAGEVASRLAIDAATVPDPDPGEDPAVRVMSANAAVIEGMRADPRHAGMGTTLTLGIFEPDGTLRIGHVGDSRGYLLRDGVLRQLTQDHSLVGQLVAGGHITADEARTHPRRHLVTQSIGMQKIDVDRVDETLQPGDRILLCSDGLTDMVPDDDITDLLLQNEGLSDAAWSLIDAANAAGGVDNTTVAVVDVGP